MSRGGDRRKPVPEMDSIELMVVLDNFVKANGVKQAFSFGTYDVIGRSQAVYAGGLAENYDLLETILSVAPAGEVKASVLRGHLVKLALKYDGLTKNSPLSKDLWAGKAADTISTMLAHLRRVRLDIIRAKQMQHKATDADVIAVEKLCNLLELPDVPAFELSSPSDCTSVVGSRASSPGRDTCFYPAPSRKLQREVSLDDHGYPYLFVQLCWPSE